MKIGVIGVSNNQYIKQIKDRVKNELHLFMKNKSFKNRNTRIGKSAFSALKNWHTWRGKIGVIGVEFIPFWRYTENILLLNTENRGVNRIG